MNIENQPTRVKFQQGQILRTQDLTDEQQYHLEMRRRHNLALHTWGIAYGLDLIAKDGRVFVTPGIAIDGYGRELVVAQRTVVETNDPRIDPGPFDIELNFRLIANSAGATTGFCEIQAASRVVVEKPFITIRSRFQRREPDAPVSPGLPPPDSEAQQWPVLLGTIEWRVPDEKPTDKPGWQIDFRDRKYAGIRAEKIVSPAESLSRSSAGGVRAKGPPITVIQNGSRPGFDKYSFAVYVLNKKELEDHKEGKIAPTLGVNAKHNLEFNTERLTMAGDMVFVNGAALEFRPNNLKTNTGGSPWRIYHTVRPSSANDESRSTESTSNTPHDELRITMPDQQQGQHHIAIGRAAEDGAFEEILTISNDRKVTVHGNLVVKGTVYADHVKSRAGLVGTGGSEEDQFQQQLRQFVGNADQRAEFVIRELKSALGGSYQRQAEVVIRQVVDPARQAFITQLAASEARLETVVRELLQNTRTREEILRQLVTADHRKETVAAVVENEDARVVVLDQLLGGFHSEGTVMTVLGDVTARNTAIKGLLQAEDLTTGVVDKLVANNDFLRNFARVLNADAATEGPQENRDWLGWLLRRQPNLEFPPVSRIGRFIKYLKDHQADYRPLLEAMKHHLQ
ncbi:MAG: hypothetical protein ACFCD0_11820 [Gemmataceae bacterium]